MQRLLLLALLLTVAAQRGEAGGPEGAEPPLPSEGTSELLADVFLSSEKISSVAARVTKFYEDCLPAKVPTLKKIFFRYRSLGGEEKMLADLISKYGSKTCSQIQAEQREKEARTAQPSDMFSGMFAQVKNVADAIHQAQARGVVVGEVPADVSVLGQLMSHFAPLMEDIEHILYLRKNAAAVLLVGGLVAGFPLGVMLGRRVFGTELKRTSAQNRTEQQISESMTEAEIYDKAKAELEMYGEAKAQLLTPEKTPMKQS